jgi:hypothetical protein
MVAMYRLKGLGWLASCAVVAIGVYLVSSQVAAERKKLGEVDRRIVAAQRDIRALETEFDVRANLTQLEKWNGDTLALAVPTAAQFVRSEEALAALSPTDMTPLVGGGEAKVQTASVIVPSHPVLAPVVPVAAPVTAKPATVVKVAATVTRPAAPRLTPASVAAPERPRAVKAVAMVEKNVLGRGLLSDTTIGDLLSGARAERNRLR